jgi:hypothetical protein
MAIGGVFTRAHDSFERFVTFVITHTFRFIDTIHLYTRAIQLYAPVWFLREIEIDGFVRQSFLPSADNSSFKPPNNHHHT